jgi:hypothetical protein
MRSVLRARGRSALRFAAGHRTSRQLAIGRRKGAADDRRHNAPDRVVDRGELVGAQRAKGLACEDPLLLSLERPVHDRLRVRHGLRVRDAEAAARLAIGKVVATRKYSVRASTSPTRCHFACGYASAPYRPGLRRSLAGRGRAEVREHRRALPFRLDDRVELSLPVLRRGGVGSQSGKFDPVPLLRPRADAPRPRHAAAHPPRVPGGVAAP